MKKSEKISFRKYPAVYVITILFVLGISSCKTMPAYRESENSPGPVPGQDLNDIQKKLIEGAYSILGKNSLYINNRKFTMDCSGVVMAVYWYAGIDLTTAFREFSGNGVTRIYRYLEKKELLYKTLDPAPGDIIFWDNTYDKNGDGKPNDELTHIGMVVKADNQGNIDYIHYNYRKGIVLERMNLVNPDTYSIKNGGKTIIVNSPMRMRGSPDFAKWLSSQLYRQFGMAYLID